MQKKLLKILKIIKITQILLLIAKIILILTSLSILKIIENLNTSFKMKLIINTYKTKLKNNLKFSINQFIIRFLETIFSTSIILTFISYFLDIPKIIEKINLFITQKIDEILSNISNKEKNKYRKFKEVT
ncbi:MAG: hypothetical protein ACK4ZM_00470 [bacterium]